MYFWGNKALGDSLGVLGSFCCGGGLCGVSENISGGSGRPIFYPVRVLGGIVLAL